MNNSDEIIKYYKDHSSKDTFEHFKISRSTLNRILTANNIERHTVQENNDLNKFSNNGYSAKCQQAFLELTNSIDKEEFKEYYYNNAKQAVLKKYNISNCTFNKLIDYFNINRLSLSETQKILYSNGTIIPATFSDETKGNMKQKRYATNISKYGCVSPLGNSDIKAKIAETVKERYGVKNVFQDTSIKEKIIKTKQSKYGGQGFDSPIIRNKYNKVMQDKYGVDWGCQTEQCKSANNGSDSTPNKIFASILNDLNIQYEKEFVLGNYRYDFKINNILVEINPSYSHNSTNSYRGYGEPLEPDYHLNKCNFAIDNGYRCIFIWDWDDVNKIIFLLQKRPRVFARKCRLKEVSVEESKEYLNKYHLQNYIKDDIRIGLYYNNELVSLMTFGKPRYNKNYKYELLRYCASYEVVGGAERLFTYFKKIYSPISVISYCDRSKFKGEVYSKLGFSQIRIKNSCHWYNIKTKKHITDNLLRQHGFDQLLGKEYGCYGKDYSNNDLMKNHGFVEIYDCGQVTFIYKQD